MSDPLGAQGATKLVDDLAIGLAGGQSFLERLQHLDSKKQAHDEALAQLNLGKKAEAALREAEGKKADATRLQAEASAVMEKALADAKALIDHAQEQATAILMDAHSKCNAHFESAEQVKREADVYAASTQRTANAALNDAHNARNSAQKTLIDAQNAADEHQSAVNKAKEAADKAKATQATYEGKISRLHAFLRELTA